MAKIRGKSDRVLKRIADELTSYESEHPGSAAVLYRQNPAAVRIRIVDPSFAELDRVERDDLVWNYLNKLPASARGEITVLLLLTRRSSIPRLRMMILNTQCLRGFDLERSRIP